MVAAALGYALNEMDGAGDAGRWGWRIPFFIGCMIVPFLFSSAARCRRPRSSWRASTIRHARDVPVDGRNWTIVLAGMMLVVMTTRVLPDHRLHADFGKTVLKLSTTRQPDRDAVRRPVELHLAADRRRAVGPHRAQAAAARGLGADDPHRLSGAGVAGRGAELRPHAAVLLWLSFLFGSYNGAMVVALTEMMPVEVRAAGFSLAYSLATALFGGFTPAVSTWLIEATGDKAAPGLLDELRRGLRAGATLVCIAREESHRWHPARRQNRGMRTSLPAAVVSAFTPTGVLRASINLGNPILADSDAAAASRAACRSTWRARSPSASASRWNWWCSTRPPPSVDAVRNEQADIGFFAIDPVRGEGSLHRALRADRRQLPGAQPIRRSRANEEVDRPASASRWARAAPTTCS